MHTPGPIKLYHHKTSGGAEYLSDKFFTCPNGEREGIFEGAEYIVRIDGQPELTLRNFSLQTAAPDLLEACRVAADEIMELTGYTDNPDPFSENPAQYLINAIKKATE
jgi:hypothetical protein